MFFLFVLAECVLTLLILLPLILFAPPLFALLAGVALLLFLYFARPARTLYRRYRTKGRRVYRRYHPPAVPTGLTMRPPAPESPAEVFRLMEILHLVPADRLPIADFTATLLDLNRRGLLSIRGGGIGDLLASEGLRVTLRRDIDEKKLSRHEQIFIKMLKAASGPASSVRLSAFLEYVSRSPGRTQRRTDAFRRAVDRALLQKKLLIRMRTRKRTLLFPFGRRLTVLSPGGEQLAALWRAYFASITDRPFVDSYRPQTGEPQKPFAKDALTLLTDAAAVGYCAKAAEALMRDYLFDPMDLWEDGIYFSLLTETRTAFSGSEKGEAYFFLPLRDFESAIRTAVTHGTPEATRGGFDD